MRSSKPPVLASWLVEHLIPGVNNDAMAGDLLEQFSQGRSAAWYWRQVLVAILVGFSRELRILWMTVPFTVLWLSALSQLFGAQSRAVFGWGIQFPWPVPLITTIGFFTAMNALPLLVALNIYLWVMKGFSLPRFSRGLFVGLLALAFGIFLALEAAMLLLLLVFHLVDLQQAFWMLLSRSSVLVLYTIASLPLFFGLLASMWAARPSNSLKGTPRVTL